MKRTITPHRFYTQINNENPNIYIKRKEVNEDNNFNELLENLTLATSEFYKITKNNFQTMLKLLLIQENENNNNVLYQTYNQEKMGITQAYVNKTNIINDLKLILTANQNNLYNFFNDSEMILEKFEMERKNEKKRNAKIHSENKYPIVINNYNKTIDNENHRQINNFNFSPINSLILSNRSNYNSKNKDKQDSSINSLFSKLINFNEIIGTYSPEMKNLYMKISNNLYSKYKILEKELHKNKINMSIKKATILNKSSENLSNNRINTNFNNIENHNDENGKFIETIERYKLKCDNYKFKIEELTSQLEDLKTYTNTLEKTLEDKKESNDSDNNMQNITSINYLMSNNKNLNQLNKKLIEENNQKNIYLQKKDNLIKQLNLNKNDLNLKLKEYEDIINKNQQVIDNLKKIKDKKVEASQQNYKDNNDNIIRKTSNFRIINNNHFSYKSVNNENKNLNLKNLEEKMAQKDKEILLLKNEIKTYKNKISSTEQENLNLNKKIRENDLTNSNYISKLNEKENKLVKQGKEIEELKDRFEKSKKEISKLKEEKSDYKTKYENLCFEFNNKNKENQECYNQINILNSTISKNNQTIEDKDRIISELKSINKDNINENDNQINKNDLKISLIQKEYEDEVVKLKKENEELLKLKSQMSDINKKNMDSIKELKKDKLLLENEIDELQKKISNSINSNILSNHQSYNVGLKESYNKKMSKTHSDLLRKISGYEADIEKKNKEIEGLKMFIEKLQKEKEDKILFNNNDKNNNDNINEEILKLQKENSNLKNQLEHLSTIFPKEMEELRKENEKLKIKIDNLKRERSNTTKGQ